MQVSQESYTGALTSIFLLIFFFGWSLLLLFSLSSSLSNCALLTSTSALPTYFNLPHLTPPGSDGAATPKAGGTGNTRCVNHMGILAGDSGILQACHHVSPSQLSVIPLYVPPLLETNRLNETHPWMAPRPFVVQWSTNFPQQCSVTHLFYCPLGVILGILGSLPLTYFTLNFIC